MKRLGVVLIALALLAMPTAALAGGGGAETGHYSKDVVQLWRLLRAQNALAMTVSTDLSPGAV